MPENWQPPVPAYSSQLESESVVIAYLAAQGATLEKALAGLETITDFLDTATSDFRVDRAIHRPPGGPIDAVAVAYFPGAEAFDSWAADSGFAPWWAEDARLDEATGYWQERLTLPADRIEALHSSPVPDGHSHGGKIIGPICEHAYWGGMRDRLKISAGDWLDSPLGPTLPPRAAAARGRRIVARAPENLCIIRSGQDLSDADAGELTMYDEVVRGNLIVGMRTLADEGAPIGCCAARYLTEIDSNDRPLPRTFGHCLFLSLKHLEDWAKSHPTHLSIFGSFFELLKRRDNQITLRLWHEVAVLPAGGQHFEYLNCDSQTGLSGLFLEKEPLP
jgi:aldoxime dehydratase